MYIFVIINFGLGYGSLDMTPIIQVIKSNKENKTDKSGYIFKICAANDNINNMKMHPTEW